MKQDPIDAQVGARVRAARTLAGLSQQEFARRLGISFQQLQKYETGADRISASRLYRMAVILDMSVDDFFVDPDGAPIPDLGHREGLELVRAFHKVGSRPVRDLLRRLVRQLSEEFS
ncbi:MAG: XRE family transcriptional regulator [Alphaproteobacteria bacterium]|nr:MAG: XRE family transcriptional regulator [Alphaproteobacteria bacterium]